LHLLVTVLGGTSRAVRHFCTTLETRFQDVGLSVQRDKCEIIPCAGSGHNVPPNVFEGFALKADGNFKLLGAPFGTAAFCTAHTQKRHNKAKELLRRLVGMQETQCSLLLLRHCGAFNKLAYSMRTVPVTLHNHALKEFDNEIRAALTTLADADVDQRAWQQAQLGIKRGGLGLRSTQERASSAFLASTSACVVMCRAIDACFDRGDTGNHLCLNDANTDLSARILPDAAIGLDGSRPRQKELSRLVDAKNQ